ncbi:MAG: transposase [Prosthecobacter sp.]|nr:transposase [Prosthecobacter sp.]
MPRQLRIQYPGALYHVTARGDRREVIVHDDGDREMLLATLAEACLKTGWQVLAWVLMDNHYHWLIRTPKPNLVAGMAWFQATYTQRYNAKHRVWGHLFGGRYKAIPVQGRSNGGGDYLKALMDYIHLNPVRARLVDADKGLGLLDYRWSSLAQGYGQLPKKRSKWLAVAEGLRLFDLADTTTGRRRFIERLEQRVAKEKAKQCGLPAEDLCKGGQSTLRRGWFWGSQAFEEGLCKRVQETGPMLDAGRVLRMTAETRACYGVSAAAQLQATPGSDPRKVAIAQAVHERTTVTLQWTAERLAMKSGSNVCQQIKRLKAGKLSSSKEIKQWLSRFSA